MNLINFIKQFFTKKDVMLSTKLFAVNSITKIRR
jgi:hypothetical protein